MDPIEHDLVFERFLSRRRSTLPDIDIDVESARRHEVYHRIVERFGGERTTLMSMQNSYRIRGAVRDAGLALGMDDGEIDAIAETMWRFPAGEFREALTEKPELRALAERLETDRAAGRRQLDLLVDLTERLDRLPRHLSTHPCGIILGDRRLPELTPVQPSGVDGLPMSQFDKHDMDPMGFLKLDVLGVRMQSTIAHTLEEIRRTTGERIDLETIDRDDPDTYRMIRSTHTLGCFQIESPGQRELVGKLMPESLTDLIVDISLFRPGPMGSGMVTPYLERRHGFESVRVPHPDLAPILAETHGVTIYHEQVLRLLDTMTGCGLDRADELRRALGSAEQPQVEEFVRTCAAQRGYEAGVVDEVWEVLASFGSFGFCKAHGAAFAVPTVESAWLKTHHPAAFLTGLFEHDPGMYPLRLLVAEARRLGVPLLGMDVNRSTDHYRLEELEGDDTSGTDDGAAARRGSGPRRRHGIRMALTSLKGISSAEIARIVAARPFASLADLRQRARPRRPTLRALAQVGALDALMPGGTERRGDLVSAVAEQTRSPRPAAAARSAGRQAAGQLPLPFAETDLAGLDAEHPAPERQEVIADELRLTSVDVTGHVMEIHHETLEQLGVTRAEDLLSLRSGSTVRVAGIRVATQTPPMASGRRVVFISLDDGTGCADVAFFDEAQGNTGEILFTAQLMLVEGTIRRTGPRAVSIQALDAWDLRREDQLAALRRRRVPEPPRRGRGQQGRVNASPL
ncbi:OB-fold nucleic acid binding domain-containing protein [Nesterenkonia sp. F]|uniref:helix-hairpin-helix domain-containing protein n=1 Tax=Nesterenkonia sp. F TaxID=795955 RepID=UPI00030736EA|nr:OB-fold nucleic acid binding domain-containing protein [Nesterenkonia sp. F]